MNKIKKGILLIVEIFTFSRLEKYVRDKDRKFFTFAFYLVIDLIAAGAVVFTGWEPAKAIIIVLFESSIIVVLVIGYTTLFVWSDLEVGMRWLFLGLLALAIGVFFLPYYGSLPFMPPFASLFTDWLFITELLLIVLISIYSLRNFYDTVELDDWTIFVPILYLIFAAIFLLDRTFSLFILSLILIGLRSVVNFIFIISWYDE